MRLSLVATAVSLSLAGLTVAQDARAAVRKPIDLPQQQLELALRTLAKDWQFQVIYRTEIVGERLSRRVTGNLTPSEVLDQLLEETGLTYRFLDDHTVTILAVAPPSAGMSRVPALDDPAGVGQSRSTSIPDVTRETRRSTFWDRWRLAQSSATSDATAAQEGRDEPAEGTLEEIIVTAQKRAESLKDVPISITALGSQELETMRVQDVEDFIFTIPNASYNRSIVEETKVTLRGIGGNSGGKFSATVVTVDDAVFGSTSPGTLLSSRLLDAERIEVLRGPQGTLTGASAMGGVINIITEKPHTDGFRLDGTLDVSRYSTILTKAAANLPASDRLAFRTTAYVESSDGAVRNLGPSGGDSGYDNFGARLAARFMPTDRLTLDAAYSREEQRLGLKNALHLDAFNDPSERQLAIDQLAAQGADYFETDFIPDVGNNGGTWFTDVDEHTNLTNDLFSAKASWELGSHTASLLYGRYTGRSQNVRDRDKSELAINYQRQGYDFDSDSAELKFVSNYSGSWNWLAGLSYGEETKTIHGTQYNGDGTLGGRYNFFINFRYPTTVETYGAFGNVFWDLTERLHLTAGARWGKSESSFSGGLSFIEGTPAVLSDALGASITQINPRVALNLDLTDNVTTYVQFATGFRVGYGNDPRAGGVHETSGLGEIDVPLEVTNERVKNYEIGLKGYFLDNRASLSVAAFQADYTDLQVYGGYTLDSYVNFDVNAGEAYTRGFEVEAALRPTRGLDLRASVGYVKTQLESLLGEKTVGNVTVADARPWAATLMGQYEWPVSPNLNANLQALYNRQAEADAGFNAIQNQDGLPSFSTLNLSVGIAAEKWSAIAYIDNALDEIYWLNDPGGQSIRGLEAYFIPRTFGFRFKVALK